MRRRRQHIAGRQRVGHHIAVQLFRVAAGQPVQAVDPAIGGVQQRAGAAGVVGNPKAPHPFRVVPSPVVRDGQLRQQRRRFRASVVSSQKLAVSNQPLEHCAGQVVRLRHFL